MPMSHSFASMNCKLGMLDQERSHPTIAKEGGGNTTCIISTPLLDPEFELRGRTEHKMQHNVCTHYLIEAARESIPSAVTEEYSKQM